MSNFVTSCKQAINKAEVRAILAFVLSVALAMGFLMDKVPADEFKDVVLVCLVWYFSKQKSDS